MSAQEQALLEEAIQLSLALEESRKEFERATIGFTSPRAGVRPLPCGKMCRMVKISDCRGGRERGECMCVWERERERERECEGEGAERERDREREREVCFCLASSMVGSSPAWK